MAAAESQWETGDGWRLRPPAGAGRAVAERRPPVARRRRRGESGAGSAVLCRAAGVWSYRAGVVCRGDRPCDVESLTSGRRESQRASHAARRSVCAEETGRRGRAAGAGAGAGRAAPPAGDRHSVLQLDVSTDPLQNSPAPLVRNRNYTMYILTVARLVRRMAPACMIEHVDRACVYPERLRRGRVGLSDLGRSIARPASSSAAAPRQSPAFKTTLLISLALQYDDMNIAGNCYKYF